MFPFVHNDSDHYILVIASTITDAKETAMPPISACRLLLPLFLLLSAGAARAAAEDAAGLWMTAAQEHNRCFFLFRRRHSS